MRSTCILYLSFMLICIFDCYLADEVVSPFFGCDHLLQSTGKAKINGFTTRGYKDMSRTVASFVDLSAPSIRRILEIGCGNGHNLLDIQSMRPDALCVCANKKGYGKFQSETMEDLTVIAKHFNVTVWCRNQSNVSNTFASGETIDVTDLSENFASLKEIMRTNTRGPATVFPSIVLINGLQEEPLPFQVNSVDLIMCQNCMGRGMYVCIYIYRY